MRNPNLIRQADAMHDEARRTRSHVTATPNPRLTRHATEGVLPDGAIRFGWFGQRPGITRCIVTGLTDTPGPMPPATPTPPGVFKPPADQPVASATAAPSTGNKRTVADELAELGLTTAEFLTAHPTCAGCPADSTIPVRTVRWVDHETKYADMKVAALCDDCFKARGRRVAARRGDRQ